MYHRLQTYTMAIRMRKNADSITHKTNKLATELTQASFQIWKTEVFLFQTYRTTHLELQLMPFMRWFGLELLGKSWCKLLSQCHCPLPWKHCDLTARFRWQHQILPTHHGTATKLFATKIVQKYSRFHGLMILMTSATMNDHLYSLNTKILHPSLSNQY